MKSQFLRIIIVPSAFLFLITAKGTAQTALDYYVLPMNTLVPIGEKMNLRLQFHDQNYYAQNGTAALQTGIPPQWTIVGETNNDLGSIHPNLLGFSAIYTAPDRVPKTNPVIVTVKFKANDTTKQVVTVLCKMHIVDPGQNWFFAYSGTHSSEITRKTPTTETVKRENASGFASMLVDAMPPQDGYVSINTEQGDKVINANVGGYSNYYESYIDRFQGHIQEKAIRKYSGTPVNDQGLLFDYDPKDKTNQQGIEGAGLTFIGNGTDEFWKPKTDVPGLKKITNKVSGLNLTGIGLGHKGDKVTKIKNGFAIDFSQTKDTTYHVLNETTTEKVVEKYHAILIRINKKIDN